MLCNAVERRGKESAVLSFKGIAIGIGMELEWKGANGKQYVCVSAASRTTDTAVIYAIASGDRCARARACGRLAKGSPRVKGATRPVDRGAAAASGACGCAQQTSNWQLPVPPRMPVPSAAAAVAAGLDRPPRSMGLRLT